jgi:hypothetical protein
MYTAIPEILSKTVLIFAKVPEMDRPDRQLWLKNGPDLTG